MRSEKDGGPHEVEDELDEEELGEAVFSEATLMPDEGEADPYHGIECGPDGSEDPIRRGAGWTDESGIPGGDGARSQEGSEAAKEFHDDDAENDFCGEGAEHDQASWPREMRLSMRSWNSVRCFGVLSLLRPGEGNCGGAFQAPCQCIETFFGMALGKRRHVEAGRLNRDHEKALGRGGRRA
jgi:hypothetical protein